MLPSRKLNSAPYPQSLAALTLEGCCFVAHIQAPIKLAMGRTNWKKCKHACMCYVTLLSMDICYIYMLPTSAVSDIYLGTPKNRTDALVVVPAPWLLSPPLSESMAGNSSPNRKFCLCRCPRTHYAGTICREGRPGVHLWLRSNFSVGIHISRSLFSKG